ncbi:hypothetical protein BOTBODRAFT_101627 [Botryobasidium botryosum FD-172 SS1]|uniref:Amidohydrolase-related domain-containing protein n=1 Tax=Botryobasidium botryosum (strain FD-172 SS1) TaxID=930990 RepID=A0A067N099_BOTB1|nr:hypothetical protein BOTBODRAFT_101627 [Botryobasidium botryosum FD-172 SS1]
MGSSLKSAREIRILVSSLFEPETLAFLHNKTIVVDAETGLIRKVRSHDQLDDRCEAEDGDVRIIDLRGLTVLPGFVDTHVHCEPNQQSSPTVFLHPYSETSWTDQVTRESITERTVRAVNHAKKTLLAGFTTVRDLGTEGAEDADIALRKCISHPLSLTPGPRYFCANRALVSTGAYGPKGDLHPHREGVDGMRGAEVVDGEDECRKAVRRQIGAGADWIKVAIYEYYRTRSRMSEVSEDVGAASFPLFTKSELKCIIDTAHALGVKVAAHASRADTIKTLISLGIDSIEHGTSMDVQTLEELQRCDKPITWVPTLAAYITSDPHGSKWKESARVFRAALDMGGVRIACGGDTGVFPHGKNALELQLMVKLGADWREVLKWATLGGWECVRGMQWEGKEGERRLRALAALQESGSCPRMRDNDVPFGAIRPGFAADIIATSGDLSTDFFNAVEPKSIEFVMKGGRVYKMEGKEVEH